MHRSRIVVAVSLLCSVAVALGGAYGAMGAATRSSDACGVPDNAPVWIDYGEGPVKTDTRAVLARPGVVVAASGTAIPAYYRNHGAATAYFVIGLPKIVGQPGAPADPTAIPAAADALYAKAAASTACATPWIALNELFGSGLATPWSPTNTQYRANVLALMQGLATHGAHPVLFVNGNPNFAGDAATWWQQIGQVGSIAYEAYFDAPRISALGSLLGNRRVRLGMRRTLAAFVAAGVPAARLGLVLGFHSGLIAGAGGRQGLQPRESWLRVVKWETLAARRVALDMRLGSIWTWGWGTFGPASADPDKPAAACVSLWARNTTLCDGSTAGGAAFNASLVEGQIILPAGIQCGLYRSRRITSADVARLTALSGDRGAALDVLFARLVFRSTVTVTNAQILAVEQQSIDRDFGGDRSAYLAAIAQAGGTLGIARNVIRDELTRRAIAALLIASGNSEPTYEWMADRLKAEAATTICVRDELPGRGDIPKSDDRHVPIVPLEARLPFLFDDTVPPAPPTVTASSTPKSISLAWGWPVEVDVAGWEVFRSTTPGGPYVQLTTALQDLTQFVDTTAPLGAPSYYIVRAVDTSGNESSPSVEISATTG